MKALTFYRGAEEFITIKPDESCNQVKAVNGENVLNISFRDTRYISFQLGDYLTVFGASEWAEVYKINRLPVAQKTASNDWSYSFQMESEAYDLAKVSFMGLDSGNDLTEPEHSLMGDAEWHLKLLLDNVHRVDPDFELGEVLPTDAKLITYSKENCYNALVKIAETFGTEFWVQGKKISLTKVQQDRGRLYRQGQSRGLYTIQREAIEDKNIATRLYAYGSDKNLPPNYLASRLRLPVEADPALVSNVTVTVVPDVSTVGFSLHFTPPTIPGITSLHVEFRANGSADPYQVQAGPAMSPRYLSDFPAGTQLEVRFKTVTNAGTFTTDPITVFEDTTLPELPAPHTPYIEKNTDLYGVIEHTEYFDIYPTRTGVVTGVDATDPFKVVDTDIDFDINEYLINTPAKITFNTGQLSGYTFNLQSYTHATRTIVFLKNADEKAIDVPNEVLRPAIGDTYVLTDIMMPLEYVQDAEARLLAEAEKFLDVCSIPQVRYRVAFDEKYLRRKKYMPVIGELIWIKDEQLNVERKIRVTATNRSIVNEWDVSVEMADVVSYGTINRITSGLQTNAQDIENIQRFFASRDVMNGRMVLPTITDTSALQPVYIDPATGQLFRKI
jgi:hypothetical protein